MYGLAVLHLQLTYTTVMTRIGTIHIAAKSTTQNGMIKACIELLVVLFLSTSDIYAAQHLFPCIVTLFLSLIKGHILGLRLAVQTGILDRCIRDTYCYGYLFILLCGEGDIDSGTRTISFSLTLTDISPIESSNRGNLLVKNSREIDRHLSTWLVLLNVLGKGNHITLYGFAILANLNVGILHSTTLA